MICCCALAGTRACENCRNKAEYKFNKPNVINLPYTPVDMGEKRLQEIENAIKRLNERIDEILEQNECNGSVTSDDFPEKPYEGQYFEVKGKLYRYLDDIWVQLK